MSLVLTNGLLIVPFNSHHLFMFLPIMNNQNKGQTSTTYNAYINILKSPHEHIAQIPGAHFRSILRENIC